MPKPSTAKLTLEISYEDGSRAIIETKDLDASQLPERGNTQEWHDHIELGMKDPFYDPEDFDQRQRYWVDQTLRVPRLDSHFYLKLQLPPVDRSGSAVYTLTEIEPPATNLVMIWNSGLPAVCNFDERKAQKKAKMFGTGPGAPIYFLLDIP